MIALTRGQRSDFDATQEGIFGKQEATAYGPGRHTAREVSRQLVGLSAAPEVHLSSTASSRNWVWASHSLMAPIVYLDSGQHSPNPVPPFKSLQPGRNRSVFIKFRKICPILAGCSKKIIITRLEQVLGWIKSRLNTEVKKRERESGLLAYSQV